MSLSFPLPLATFWDAIKVASVEWRLSRPQSLSQGGDGTIFRASRGAALWRGQVQLAPAHHDDATGVEALLALLDGGGSFLAYDPRRTGLIGSGSGTATIASISGDRRVIALAGFTGTITAGDMLGITYGSNPVRYGLHRAVTGATNGGAFEVVPALRPAITTGLPVTYTKPVAKCVLEPGPSYGSGRPIITAGATFGIIQTLR